MYTARRAHRKHLSCGFHAIAITALSLSLLPSLLCLRYHVKPSALFVYARNADVQKKKMCFIPSFTAGKKEYEDEKTRIFITYSSQNETDVRAFVCKSGAYYWVKMSHRPISQCA